MQRIFFTLFLLFLALPGQVKGQGLTTFNRGVESIVEDFNKTAMISGIKINLIPDSYAPWKPETGIFALRDRYDGKNVFSIYITTNKTNNYAQEFTIICRPANKADFYKAQLFYFVTMTTLSPELKRPVTLIPSILEELGVTTGQARALILGKIIYSHLMVPKNTMIARTDVGGFYFSARALEAPKSPFPRYPDPRERPAPAIPRPDTPSYSI